ncbi:hypothetical protein Uis1B_1614 [Bifidobacterium margollesii]|uniref:Uncharacterized protein n=1 Tax=Bifidobacterium margollesii TaxID=2020964 RepID=A0A2N5J8C4_9BIFI|nr:hypothetical protein Uis1B_1614 [Bifidobacterium margollesii]
MVGGRYEWEVEAVDAMDAVNELRYIGHNVAAASHLLSNVSDSMLLEIFGTLDAAGDSYYRNIVGVEMLRRGMEPGGDVLSFNEGIDGDENNRP